MAALLILNYDVQDPDGLAAYRAVAAPILTLPGGGERLVTTTDTIDLGEGGGAGTHTVVFRFPSVAAAREVYGSQDYQAVVGGRLAATRPRLAMIVERLD